MGCEKIGGVQREWNGWLRWWHTRYTNQLGDPVIVKADAISGLPTSYVVAKGGKALSCTPNTAIVVPMGAGYKVG